MNTKHLITVVAVALLTACVTTPKSDPSFTRAQAEVQAASADPAVARYAPQELDRAHQELDRAQTATQHEAIVQHAYLAGRHAALAREQTREALARAKLASGEEERTRIQLAARTAEAERAKRETQAARAETAAATTEAAQAQGQAAQLQQQAQQLQQQLSDLQAKQTDRGLVVTLNDVLFDSGKSELKSGAYRQLDKVVMFLQAHPERTVAIEGFTDSIGGDAYNEQLSERRAQAVKDALAGRGIGAGRMQARGYGKAYPIATNSEAGGRQLNRRVEVVISTGANQIAPRD